MQRYADVHVFAFGVPVFVFSETWLEAEFEGGDVGGVNESFGVCL